MKMLFCLRAINYDRHFEALLREMLERGHAVHVALDVQKKGSAGSPRLFEELRRSHDRLSWGSAPAALKDANSGLTGDLRFAIDYLRFLDPRFADAQALRERARERAPAGLTDLARMHPFSSPRGRRALDRTLRRAEQAAPVSPDLLKFVRKQRPDVIVVSPLVGLGSPQGEYVRAARALGIPCVLLVASWDNLTNKGVIRDAPDLTIVWNGRQVEEAVELHGLDRDRVLAVGAHTYDHWFGWSSSRDRERFCADVGLDSTRPILLYTGSSGFVAPNESEFVRKWVAAIRSSDNEALRAAGILVRPHPAARRLWSGREFQDLLGVVIWPGDGQMPTDQQAKCDYFDSIYHAAAVAGINTSALVESAIVGRPVLTVLADEYRDTQERTLHFNHLVDGGPLKVAADMESHVRDLAAVIDGDESHIQRNARFLSSFVRPKGTDRPVAPLAVDAVEDVATRPPAPATRPRSDRLVRAILQPALRVVDTASSAGSKLAPREGSLLVQRPRRPANGDSLRILFCVDHPGILIHFDSTVEELARRGHSVHLTFGRAKKHEEGLRALDMSSGRIVIEPVTPRRHDLFTSASHTARATGDYVHYLDPALEAASYSREKWRSLADLPKPLRALYRFDRLPPRVVDAILGTCAAIEDVIPPPRAVDDFLDRIDPDVVLVTPLISQRSYQTDLVKSARGQGRHTALCVASWDNLTSKGLIRVVPDRVILWNATQRDEAIRYHGVPESRIVTTGAQNFDRWHDREPRWSSEKFRDRMGLPTDKPYILFVGSSRLSLSEDDEERFCRRWLGALRGEAGAELRDLPVLIRPHPRNVDLWTNADFSELGEVRVWQRDISLPVLEDDRAEYYDSMHHAAAVVGINSSALLESAIIGRPAHTVLLPEFEDLQTRLIHFCYTLSRNGGFLREADSIEEHLRLLGEDIADPERIRPMQRRFLDPFIRPRGTNKAAMPFLVEAIEEMAGLPIEHEPRPGARSRLLRGAVLASALLTRAPVALHRAGRLGTPAASRLRRRVEADRVREGRARLVLRPQIRRALMVTADQLEARGSRSRRWLKARGELPGKAKTPKPEKPPRAPKVKKEKPAQARKGKPKPANPGKGKRKSAKVRKDKPPALAEGAKGSEGGAPSTKP